jgi:hypothetical protein
VWVGLTHLTAAAVQQQCAGCLLLSLADDGGVESERYRRKFPGTADQQNLLAKPLVSPWIRQRNKLYFRDDRKHSGFNNGQRDQRERLSSDLVPGKVERQEWTRYSVIEICML